MKRSICMFLALALLIMSSAAFADSKTTSDMTTVQSVSGVTSGTLNVQTVDSMPPAVAAIAREVLAAVESMSTPVEYFSTEVIDQIVDMVPGVDTQALHLDELASITATDIVLDGDVATLVCAFPTQYEVGQNVVVVIGTMEDDEITWVPVPTTVLADGSLSIELPQDVVMAAMDGTVLMAVLSE